MRSDRTGNVTVCPDSPEGEHAWTPVQFVMEHGNIPDPDAGRLYLVCLPCHAHTYMITEWVGYQLGEGPLSDESGAES